MPFIPKDERPSLAVLAGLTDDQASELSLALSTASAELDRDGLSEHVVNGAPSVEPDLVKEILKTVRQIAAVPEILEVPMQIFIEDVAEEMSQIEEDEFRLNEDKQGKLRDRLAALTEAPAIEFHAKTRSLRQDRENGYCRARIIDPGSAHASDHVSPRFTRGSCEIYS